MEQQPNSSQLNLSGHLLVKQSGKRRGKFKSGKKKKYWYIFDENQNTLTYHKSKKEVSTKQPAGSLHLYGATVYYGDASAHEFIVNLRGTEYAFTAENHKSMMTWVTALQENIKMNRSKSMDTVLEENGIEADGIETAHDERNDINGNHKKRFSSIFRWPFRSSSHSSQNRNTQNFSPSQDVSNNDQLAHVKAAPHRAVVGSMYDLSSEGASCTRCKIFEQQNTNLSNEIKNLKQALEESKQSKVGIDKDDNIENIKLKIEILNFIQENAMAEESCFSIKDFKHYDRLVDLLSSSGELPELNDYVMVLHTDELGFIHGERETPQHQILYMCQQVKNHFRSLIKESDENYSKWSHYMRSSSDETFKINIVLKELVKSSIPHEYRPITWKRLVSARVQHIKEEKGSDYYKKLIEKLPDLQGEETDEDTPIQKQIKMDLLRTLPSHKNFMGYESEGVKQLHRVLRAFLLHNLEVSYCQGMNFMVAIGLLYLDEEDAFWLLVAITEVFFSSKHYNHYLSGSQADQRVLDNIATKKMPELMIHFSELNVELAPISFNWFMTLFIDSLPVEVVLKVWDCFLVYGHPILFRFAIALLFIHQGALITAKDSLSLMRQLKKMGRSFYDSEALFNLAFERLEPFPTDEMLMESYTNHFDVIEDDNRKREEEDEEFERRKQKLKFTPKPMMVSFANNLNENPDDMTIECAECEDNRNLVWLGASTPNLGQIYILNVASRNINPISWHVSSRVLSMARSPLTNIMLVGTAQSTLHAFDIETRNELWVLSLDDGVASISCDFSGNLIATMADGAVAFMELKIKDIKPPSFPAYLHVGRSPVLCGLILDDLFWCGCGNKIVVIAIKTLDVVDSLPVCPKTNHYVSKLVEGEHGIWSTIKGSSVIHLWDSNSLACLMTVDVLGASGLISEKQTTPVSGTRITSILAKSKQLWVGFGNGRFIIFDLLEKNSLSQNDDLNDLISTYKSSMENLADIDDNVVKDESKAMEEWTMTGGGESTSSLSTLRCCHDIDDEDTNFEDNIVSIHASQDTADAAGYLSVSRNSFTTKNARNIDKFTLSMRQIQRVSEDPVRCFIPCRNDRRLMLTCMGTLGDDQAVILWSCERREDREMWFAQTVSMNETVESPISPTGFEKTI